MGFILAVSSNYLLNRIWSFESANPSIANEYASFLVVSLIGLLINNAILYVVHERYKQGFYLSN